MKMEDIKIEEEFIKLGQFLKYVDLVSSGGEIESFLYENIIIINDQEDNRKGRKLYRGDIVEVLGKKYQIC